jgi:hypothetical protein
MPANVVKTSKDEKLWKKAKKQAEKEGQADNWAYIMAIYQKMKGVKKSLFDILKDFGQRKYYLRIPEKGSRKGNKRWRYFYSKGEYDSFLKNQTGVKSSTIKAKEKKKAGDNIKSGSKNKKRNFKIERKDIEEKMPGRIRLLVKNSKVNLVASDGDRQLWAMDSEGTIIFYEINKGDINIFDTKTIDENRAELIAEARKAFLASKHVSKGVLFGLSFILDFDLIKSQLDIFGKEEVQKPGSRGGKFWIDKQGKVRHGDRPDGWKQQVRQEIDEIEKSIKGKKVLLPSRKNPRVRRWMNPEELGQIHLFEKPLKGGEGVSLNKPTPKQIMQKQSELALKAKLKSGELLKFIENTAADGIKLRQIATQVLQGKLSDDEGARKLKEVVRAASMAVQSKKSEKSMIVNMRLGNKIACINLTKAAAELSFLDNVQNIKKESSVKKKMKGINQQAALILLMQKLK